MSYEPRSHPVAIVVLLCFATLAGTVAIGAIWANQQLLSTSSWVSVSGHLLESKSVRHRVAQFLGEELAGQAESQLNAAGQSETAEAVVPRLRAEGPQLAERAMKTKQFKAVWATANRTAHQDLLRVLDEKGGAGQEEAVVVNLTPALRQLADLVEEEGAADGLWVTNLAGLVPPGAARIQVLEAQELRRAQDVVRVIRDLTAPAVIVTLALYAIVLFLGWRRIGPTLVGIGLALAATGGLALLLRSLFGSAIVDQLIVGGRDQGAADAAWRIATSKIADLAGIAIGLGAVIVLLVAAVAVFRVATAQRELAR
jgi:hypothetical protein